MNRLSYLFQQIILTTLSTLLSFCIAWPVAFKFGWTYSSLFDGKSVSDHDCFLTLLLMLSIAFKTIGNLGLYIFRLEKSINKEPLLEWKKNVGIKPKAETVNVVLSNGSVLWLRETSLLDFSLDAKIPITEYMPKQKIGINRMDRLRQMLGALHK